MGRFLPTIRLPWNPPSKKPSNGSMPIQQARKRSTKKNRSPSKVLQCRFFRRWQEELAECPEVCQVACQTWVAVCPIWAEHLPVLIPVQVPPSKKSTKVCSK